MNALALWTLIYVLFPHFLQCMHVRNQPSLLCQTSDCTHRYTATGCLYLICKDCCVVGQPIFQLTELMSLFRPQWWTKLDLFSRPGTLVCSLSHTQLRNTCIPSADPLWCLIPPHFSRPLLLSNWSSGEYNYGENHPGLMWGWINGIKKIICWPSGPATVWGWEGNLKQRGEEMVGALMSRLTKSPWPLRALFDLSLWGLLSPRLPTTIAPYCSHLAKSFEDVQSSSEDAVK